MAESFPQAADLRGLIALLRTTVAEVARSAPEAHAYTPCVDALAAPSGPDALALRQALASAREPQPSATAPVVDGERSLAHLRLAVRSVAGAALTRTPTREVWATWREDLLGSIARARYAAGVTDATARTSREFQAARRARAALVPAAPEDNRTALGAVVLGATVATLRACAGWSAEEFCARTKHDAVTPRYLAQLERATAPATYLGSVAETFGMSTADLVALVDRGHALAVQVAARGVGADTRSRTDLGADALEALARFTAACVVVRERGAPRTAAGGAEGIDLVAVSRGAVLAVRRAGLGLTEAEVVQALDGALTERQLRQVERGTTRTVPIDALARVVGTTWVAVDAHAEAAAELARRLACLGLPDASPMDGATWTSTTARCAGTEAVVGLLRFCAACVVLRS